MSIDMSIAIVPANVNPICSTSVHTGLLGDTHLIEAVYDRALRITESVTWASNYTTINQSNVCSCYCPPGCGWSWREFKVISLRLDVELGAVVYSYGTHTPGGHSPCRVGVSLCPPWGGHSNSCWLHNPQSLHEPSLSGVTRDLTPFVGKRITTRNTEM